MPPTDLAPALAPLFDQASFDADPVTGIVLDPAGSRVVYAPVEFTRAIHHVLHREKSAAWREALALTGRACGRDLAAQLDRESVRLGQPALDALPLESCLGLLERLFATHGWGVLTVDLSAAPEHGLVIAHLTHSYFAEALSDTADFVGPFPAGLLQGFFESISGEALGCVELACVRRGAPRCTFVITAPERLDAIAPFLGLESAEAIIVRLQA